MTGSGDLSAVEDIEDILSPALRIFWELEPLSPILSGSNFDGPLREAHWLDSGFGLMMCLWTTIFLVLWLVCRGRSSR